MFAPMKKTARIPSLLFTKKDKVWSALCMASSKEYPKWKHTVVCA